MTKPPFLLGRFVFGSFFPYNGINHFLQHREMAQYVDAKNVPMPDVAVTASGVALVLGGASLALGVKPAFGAAAVAGFLAGVSPIMHDFWRVQDPEKGQGEMINFSKNMGLLGAALARMGVESRKPKTLSQALRLPQAVLAD
jgi:putative oxidoreductase